MSDYHINMIFLDKKPISARPISYNFIYQKKLVQVFFKICHKSSFCQIKLLKMINTKPQFLFQLDIMTWIRYHFAFNHMCKFFNGLSIFFPQRKAVSVNQSHVTGERQKVTWPAKKKNLLTQFEDKWKTVKISSVGRIY